MEVGAIVAIVILAVAFLIMAVLFAWERTKRIRLQEKYEKQNSEHHNTATGNDAKSTKSKDSQASSRTHSSLVKTVGRFKSGVTYQTDALEGTVQESAQDDVLKDTLTPKASFKDTERLRSESVSLTQKPSTTSHTFAVGDVVVIHGLSGKKDLNGLAADVVSAPNAKGCAVVAVRSPPHKVLIHTRNLRKHSAPHTLRRMTNPLDDVPLGPPPPSRLPALAMRSGSLSKESHKPSEPATENMIVHDLSPRRVGRSGTPSTIADVDAATMQRVVDATVGYGAAPPAKVLSPIRWQPINTSATTDQDVSLDAVLLKAKAACEADERGSPFNSQRRSSRASSPRSRQDDPNGPYRTIRSVSPPVNAAISPLQSPASVMVSPQLTQPIEHTPSTLLRPGLHHVVYDEVENVQ